GRSSSTSTRARSKAEPSPGDRTAPPFLPAALRRRGASPSGPAVKSVRFDNPHALVAVSFVALTFAWGSFLFGHLGSGFAHDAGDPLLNTWILWWNARVVPFSPGWWNAPAFYPATGAATFTENLVGLGLIAT